MFHAAVSIFSPHNKKDIDYLQALARTRIINYTQQQFVSELTFLTTVVKDQPNLLKTYLKTPDYFNKIDVLTLQGAIHSGSGLLQMLIDPTCPWIYFDEDGHDLPIREDSVQKWFTRTEKLFGHQNFDILLDGNGILEPRNIKPEHLKAFCAWKNEQGELPSPTLRNCEWGMYQSRNSLRKFLRPPDLHRSIDGCFFLHQGARIACSNLRCAYFVHQRIIGPSTFQLFNPKNLQFRLNQLPSIDPSWNFAERFKKQLITILENLRPIERMRYEKGKLIDVNENYWPEWLA